MHMISRWATHPQCWHWYFLFCFSIWLDSTDLCVYLNDRRASGIDTAIARSGHLHNGQTQINIGDGIETVRKVSFRVGTVIWCWRCCCHPFRHLLLLIYRLARYDARYLKRKWKMIDVIEANANFAFKWGCLRYSWEEADRPNEEIVESKWTRGNNGSETDRFAIFCVFFLNDSNQ